MSKPIYIYILTNKCFNKDDLVKIDIQMMLREELKTYQTPLFIQILKSMLHMKLVAI